MRRTLWRVKSSSSASAARHLLSIAVKVRRQDIISVIGTLIPKCVAVYNLVSFFLKVVTGPVSDDQIGWLEKRSKRFATIQEKKRDEGLSLNNNSNFRN